jgi:FkbM family methyltransferase
MGFCSACPGSGEVSLLETLQFIAGHPVNRRRTLRGLPEFVGWQLRCRLSKGPHVMNWVGGTRFFARRGETGVTGNIYVGLHEFEDMAFTLHVLRPESLFIDVGANAGSYTLLAAGAVGCRVMAIEPVPETFRRLQQNLELNGLRGRVDALNLAVGGEQGSAAFTSMQDAMNHALPAGTSATGAITVPVVRLDDLLHEEAPELVKVDVEGYEAAVLSGGTHCFSPQGTNAVLLELNGSGARYGWSDADVAQQLFDAGYNTYQYLPFERRLVLKGRELRGAGNTLFIRDAIRAGERLATSPTFRVKAIDV